ncbi:hypothetical protein SDJN03_23304, partial [Cucurbita argyrosperma subsp. sororia]
MASRVSCIVRCYYFEQLLCVPSDLSLSARPRSPAFAYASKQRSVAGEISASNTNRKSCECNCIASERAIARAQALRENEHVRRASTLRGPLETAMALHQKTPFTGSELGAVPQMTAFQSWVEGDRE